MKAQTFADIAKFNPYHGKDGRFASANGYASFTYAPGKSKAHDMAIAREQERAAVAPVGTNTDTRGHMEYMPHKEVVALTMEECGVNEAKAKDMVKAVSGYAEGYAYEMRKWQQTGKASDELTNEEASKMSADIEEYITKSPKWEGGELYRGIAVDSSTAQSIYDRALTDRPLDMKGTSSWSSNKEIADDFGDAVSDRDTTIIFKTPGTQKGTSITHLSEFDQAEVIISKDARWTCKQINGSLDDMYLEITLEEVP